MDENDIVDNFYCAYIIVIRLMIHYDRFQYEYIGTYTLAYWTTKMYKRLMNIVFGINNGYYIFKYEYVEHENE